MSIDDLRHLVSSDYDLSGDEEQKLGLHGGPLSVRMVNKPSETPSSPRPLDKVSVRRQLWASLGFCLGGFAMGNTLGWSSSALPELESSTSPILVSQSEGAFIGALVCLGALFQGPMTGYLMVRFGRRATMILNCVPLIAGWMSIIGAKTVWMLFLGRFVTGFAIGSFSVIAPVYIGEIASPVIRGALGTCFQIMVVFGIFVMFVLGAYVSWKSLAIFSVCITLVLILVVYSLQDSPTSYMMRNRPDLARKALIWLRNTADIEDEIYAIQKSVYDMRQNGSGRIRMFNIFCIRDPTVRKPLLLCMFLAMSQQLSGVNAVMTFTVSIFQSAGASVDPNTATIIIGAIQLVATVLSSFTVNRVGRKTTLIISLSVMALSLISFGTFFYLNQRPLSTSVNLGWLPLLSLGFFIVSFSFGPGPLVWLMLGELLSPKIVGVAGGVASITTWGLAFSVTLGFPFMVKFLGDFGTYWLFALCCITSVLVVIRYLPETRNKTLREIQDNFTK